jgi:hypothetical protein
MADINANAAAARRALDTLLRNADSRTVLLRVPAPAVAGEPAEQLGLATPLFQDVVLAPAVFRKALAGAAKDGHYERELLVSATTVATLTGSHDFGSADALFASAFGVLIDETLLAIVSAKEIEAGGVICGYRLTLLEPVTSA